MLFISVLLIHQIQNTFLFIYSFTGSSETPEERRRRNAPRRDALTKSRRHGGSVVSATRIPRAPSSRWSHIRCTSSEDRLLLCLPLRSRKRTSFGRHRRFVQARCRGQKATSPSLLGSLRDEQHSGGKKDVQVWCGSFNELGDGVARAGWHLHITVWSEMRRDQTGVRQPVFRDLALHCFVVQF